MLDFIRNLGKSKEEKRQEALHAYLDGSLTPEGMREVEHELEKDSGLREDLAQYRLIQNQMRQLPRRRAPRNFTLDPALYGRPHRQPLIKAYPVLRTATVLAAFFFVFAVAVNIFMSQSGAATFESAAPVALESAADAKNVSEITLAATPERDLEAPSEETVDEEQAAVEESSEELEAFRQEEAAAPIITQETVEAVEIEQLDFEKLEEGLAPPSPPGILDSEEAESAESLSLPAPAEESTESERMAESVITAEEPAEAAADIVAVPTTVDDETGAESTLSRQTTTPRNPFGGIVLISGFILLVLIILTILTRQRY